MPSRLFQDLRYAVRTLWKSPGFTAVAVLTLGLGIGANSAIFSVVYAVLLRPLPYPEPERLTIVWGWHPDIGTETASAPDYVDWHAQNRVFSAMAALSGRSFNLTGAEGEGEADAERLRGARVSAEFFDVMGIEAAIGRTPLPAEDVPDAARVVVLSDRLWQRRFGSDPEIIGRTVALHGTQYEVIGIAPRGFGFPGNTDLWVPLALDASQFGRRGDFLLVVGRLAPGVELETAQAEMTTIASRLEEEYPATNARWSIRVIPLHEQIVGDTRPALLAFLGAVGFVLLIACANVANLLLARASARGHEMAVRAAIGAGRGRLVKQLLTESALLAAIGGAAGIALAALGVRALVAMGPDDIPRLDTVGIDVRVLIFTLVVSVGTGFLFGIVPALRTSRANLGDSLKEGGLRSIGSVRKSRFRSGLVVAEVALAIVLLMGAGLLIRSFAQLQRVDPGFQPAGLLTFRLSLPSSAYAEDDQVRAFHDRLRERLAGAPGVTSVGSMSGAPLRDGAGYLAFLIEGRPVPDASVLQDVQVHTADAGYFQTMGIPLKEGRLFSSQDAPEAVATALISETMARRYWPGESALGARITFAADAWVTVVGVVGDIHHEGLDSEPYPQAYLPLSQNPRRSLAYVVRASPDLAALTPVVRADVAALDPTLPVFGVAAMSDLLTDSIARPRFNFMLIVIFAFVAATLAAVGLYGVMAQSVAERSHEIGVRMALGAESAAMVRTVVGEAARLTLLGGVIGLGASLFVTRLLTSLLYGVSMLDPLTYTGVGLALVLVACGATLVPAWRASRVDPIEVLRYE